MNKPELKVIGQEHIGKFKFTGIEGGFGEGKKAMLVKDIATIHDKELRQINQAINMNRKRFKDGIDIADLLNQSDGFRKFAQENGLIGSNRTQHVYLLSERGYAKLLKILDDDKAWDIYDQLVDNYFNMRETIRKVQRKPDSYMIEDPVKRAERWIEERKQYEVLVPKAQYYDAQMRNPGLMTVTEIAKDYGMSASNFNRLLHDKGIQYKQGRHWVLYQKYANEGYTQYEPYAYNDNAGVHNNLKWNQRGKKFIYDTLAQDGIYPLNEQLELLPPTEG